MLELFSKFVRCLPRRLQQKVLLAFPITMTAALFELLFLLSLVPMLGMLTGDKNEGLYSTITRFICSSESECETNIILISILVMIVATVVRILTLRYTTQLAYDISHEVGSMIFSNHLYKKYKDLKMESNSKLNTDILAKSNLILGDVSLPALNIMSSVFTVIFILIGLFSTTLIVSVTSFVSLFLMYVIIIRITKRTLPLLSKIYKEKQEAVYQTINDSSELVREVRYYHLEQYFLSTFRKFDSSLKENLFKIQMMSVTPRFLVEPFAIIILLCIGLVFTHFGGKSIINELGILAISFLRLLPNIQAIYQGSTRIKSAYEILEDIISLLSIRIPPPKKTHFTLKKEIQLVDLSVSINDQKILQNITLSINSGEKIALVGESGSGKSTLLNLISGLITPSSGAIQVDGKIFSSFDNTRNTVVSIIDQNPKFIPDSIQNSILFLVGENQFLKKNILDKNSIKNYYNRFNLDKDYGPWEEKKESFLGDDGANISGGQKQRLKIVQALALEPMLLLADEPTSALDEQNSDLVFKEICLNSPNLTVVCAIHDPTKLHYFDRTVHLNRGEIIKISKE